MRRREFITLVGGTAAIWPLAARAQQPKQVRRIGVVMNLSENDPDAQRRIEAFRDALRELGWTDGRNATIDTHLAAGDATEVRSAISEMVEFRPEVILVTATNVLTLLRPVAPGTPIVFVLVSDPVGQGFVDSLAHPGGRITGFTSFEFSMSGKWLETLKEVVPQITRAALIFNPETAPYGEKYFPPLQSAAQLLGVEPLVFRVRSLGEIEKTVSTFAHSQGSKGLIVIPDAFTVAHRAPVIALAAANRLPSIYSFRFFTTEGGLLSYGIDNIDLYRRAASYVDKILKGANPAELPIQQPTKFELVVNVKTAKALGLAVSQSLLARADEVIE
jgi:putative tryptophan/tyrosine transport system substrate-binding protein